MATLSTELPTMLDWAKTRDPSGKTAKIIEMLSQLNKANEDMVMIEGNLPTGHQDTIRTGLPTGFYRLMNQGTPSETSTEVQVTESCAMLTGRSNVDVKLANLNGDVSGFRMQKSRAHLEGMGQTAATTLF